MASMANLWNVTCAERGSSTVIDSVLVLAPTVDAASKKAAKTFRACGLTRFVIRTVEWKGEVVP